MSGERIIEHRAVQITDLPHLIVDGDLTSEIRAAMVSLTEGPIHLPLVLKVLKECYSALIREQQLVVKGSCHLCGCVVRHTAQCPSAQPPIRKMPKALKRLRRKAKR
jgi:hypothetical protein